MLVPPAPKYQPAKNHYQSNPNIASHHFNTNPFDKRSSCDERWSYE